MDRLKLFKGHVEKSVLKSVMCKLENRRWPELGESEMDQVRAIMTSHHTQPFQRLFINLDMEELSWVSRSALQFFKLHPDHRSDDLGKMTREETMILMEVSSQLTLILESIGNSGYKCSKLLFLDLAKVESENKAIHSFRRCVMCLETMGAGEATSEIQETCLKLRESFYYALPGNSAITRSRTDEGLEKSGGPSDWFILYRKLMYAEQKGADGVSSRDNNRLAMSGFSAHNMPGVPECVLGTCPSVIDLKTGGSTEQVIPNVAATLPVAISPVMLTPAKSSSIVFRYQPGQISEEFRTTYFRAGQGEITFEAQARLKSRPVPIIPSHISSDSPKRIAFPRGAASMLGETESIFGFVFSAEHQIVWVNKFVDEESNLSLDKLFLKRGVAALVNEALYSGKSSQLEEGPTSLLKLSLARGFGIDTCCKGVEEFKYSYLKSEDKSYQNVFLTLNEISICFAIHPFAVIPGLQWPLGEEWNSDKVPEMDFNTIIPENRTRISSVKQCRERSRPKLQSKDKCCGQISCRWCKISFADGIDFRHHLVLFPKCDKFRVDNGASGAGNLNCCGLAFGGSMYDFGLHILETHIWHSPRYCSPRLTQFDRRPSQCRVLGMLKSNDVSTCRPCSQGDIQCSYLRPGLRTCKHCLTIMGKEVTTGSPDQKSELKSSGRCFIRSCLHGTYRHSKPETSKALLALGLRIPSELSVSCRKKGFQEITSKKDLLECLGIEDLRFPENMSLFDPVSPSENRIARDIKGAILMRKRFLMVNRGIKADRQLPSTELELNQSKAPASRNKRKALYGGKRSENFVENKICRKN